MANIFGVHNCFGCGLCAVVCKHNVIDMRLNSEGFFQPFILDVNRCIDCGLCGMVCSYLNSFEEVKPVHSYAAWSMETKVLKTTSSGGVSYEIGKYLISQGYKFCGVKYNVELARAEHYIADNLQLLELSKGSKYLQSYTKDAFAKINKKEKYIVVGTPCQIASFRRYIELYKCSDNFILLDFFCHGVPSYLLWEKYKKEHEKDIGKIISASWRNKINGWHKSYCITLEGEKKYIYQSQMGKDEFFTLFLGDACLNQACFKKCKFKYGNSSADIRIGDFWGSKYEFNDAGVCSAIAFTDKGDNVLKNAKLELHEYTFDVVAEGQMKRNPLVPWHYKRTMCSLKNDNIKLSSIAQPVRISKKISDYINRFKEVINL